LGFTYIIGYQSIAYDPGVLVAPDPNQIPQILEASWFDQQQSREDAGQILQIENVVELRWGRWQVHNHHLWVRKQLA